MKFNISNILGKIFLLIIIILSIYNTFMHNYSHPIYIIICLLIAGILLLIDTIINYNHIK